MIRQAARTLLGRADGDVDETQTDPFYLSPGQTPTETVDAQDGQTDDQDGQDDLRSMVQRLSADVSTLSSRLGEKDRYIGQLEGENRTLRAGVPTSAAGREPVQDPDPVMDEATAAQFAQAYENAPEKAILALAQHMEERLTSRATADQANRDRQAQYTQAVQAVERNILRQVDLAIHSYGEAAKEVVGDFIDLARRGDASSHEYAQTWLGQQLVADPTIAQTTQGVNRLIEVEVLRRQGNTQNATQAQPQPQPAPRVGTGISRPAAPTRHVEASQQADVDERSVEDQIGDSILKARSPENAMAIFTG